MRAALTIFLLTIVLNISASDTLTTAETPAKEEGWLKRTLRKFTEIDTNYVEPQHYNWALMLQGTYNYDIYRLSSKGDNKQTVTFAPAPTFKVGPYFGWRWIFLGYTVDIKNFNVSKIKQEFDFSFYASQVGVDLRYHTPFFAPSYDPFTGLFRHQDETLVGGYI